MKVLKFIGLTLLTLIVLYVIIAAVSSKDVVVEVNRTTEHDPQTVYSAVNDFNQYGEWNAWFKMDPNVKYEVSGTGKNIGDKWSWESQMREVGTGHMVHESAEPGKGMINEMYFEEMDAYAKDVWMFEPTDNGGTKITWRAEMEAPFMMRPFFSSMMQSGLSPMFEQSLDSLEAHLSSAEWEGFAEEQSGPWSYVYISEEIPVNQIGETYGKDINAIYTYLAKKSVEPAGPPMAIYHSWGETTKMDVAVPVSDLSFKLPTTMMRGELAAGKAATFLHVGSYEESEAAHYKMDEYLQLKGHEFKGPVVEVYYNNPEEVAPEDLETKIIYFVQ